MAWRLSRVLALIELTLCTVPGTFLWMMLTPGLIILTSAGIWFERGSVGVSTLAVLWWCGGGLGLHALWRLTLPEVIDDVTVRPSTWDTLGLLAGMAVSTSVFLMWTTGNLHFRLPAWVPVVALLPVPAAARSLMKLFRQ